MVKYGHFQGVPQILAPNANVSEVGVQIDPPKNTILAPLWVPPRELMIFTIFHHISMILTIFPRPPNGSKSDEKELHPTSWMQVRMIVDDQLDNDYG